MRALESRAVKLREAIDWGRLAPLRLVSRSVADGVYAGVHRSVRRGAGVEFGGHRSYLPGDDLRFLDRHARMRHGQLLIREFETETDRSLRLIVDASASMGFKSEQALGAKYAYASVVAAALARVALVRGDRVSLDFVAGERAVPLPSTGGREAFERIVGHLESGAPHGGADVAVLERALAPTARYAQRGSAIVIVSDLLDLPDGAQDLLAGLTSGGRTVVLLQVLDPVELAFPFEGPVALAAMEGELRVETDASAVREGYLQALGELTRDFEARVVSRGGQLLQAGSADDPVETVRRVLAALAGAGREGRGAA